MSTMNPHKKALCVGISYKGQPGPRGTLPGDFELAGAHEDVQKVCDLLIGYYGYDRRNITILQDTEDYVSPTMTNMLAAMHDLVRGATPGGSLFFFFAGHGDQITNLDGTERDNKDEIILPLDWMLDESLPTEDRKRYRNIIIDDDMNDIMVKKLPPNCKLTALFDSCHSGTLLDLPFNRYYGPRSKSPPQVHDYMTTAPRTLSPEPARRRDPHHLRPIRETRMVVENPSDDSPPQFVELEDPEDVACVERNVGRGPLELAYTLARAVTIRGRMDPYWRKGTWILRGESLDTPIHHSLNVQAVSWSACSDAQNGYEYKHENKSGGVMVKAFVELLQENPSRTYRDLLQNLGDRLRAACEQINRDTPKSQWIMQEPQLGSQNKPNLDNFFEP